jgi:dihydrofolate reductase
MILSLIVAADKNNVIGGGNTLLWNLPADMKHFRTLTEGHPIIMGRKTYESIGRPLPKRQNIVITRQSDLQIEGCDVVSSLNDALALVQETDEAFIIGGGQIYAQALDHVNRIYLTRVDSEFEGDVTFPELSDEWKETSREEHQADAENECGYAFLVYERG